MARLSASVSRTPLRGNIRLVPLLGAALLTVAAVGGTVANAWTPTTPQVTVSAFGGVEADMVTDTALDSSGNIYAVGSFQGTSDVNPGPTATNLVSAGDTDIFVMKLDPSGDLVWAHGFGASGADQANAVSVDSSGNVFVTGYYSGTVDFNPSPSTANNLVTAGAWDAFVLKLSSTGAFAWAESFGSASGNDSGTAIAVDSSGNPVVSGFFTGTVDFDPHPGSTASLTASTGRIFIVRLLSSGGASTMARNVGGSSNDESSSIAVDSSGATYLVGQFQGSSDFDPSGATQLLTSAGSTDAFMIKLSLAGALVWAQQIGSSSADLARSVALDSSGNVTLSGDFRDTVDFNPDSSGIFNLTAAGISDAFVVQLGSNGSFRWARHIGGTNIEHGRSITLDNSGNVYLTGRFHGSNADFDPSPTSTFALSSAGGADVYVLKLDMLGMFAWAKKLGSWGTDEGVSVSTDTAGNVFVAGRFELTVAFDPDGSSPTIASNGNTDSFIAKMTPSGATAVTAAPTTAAPATTVAAGSATTTLPPLAGTDGGTTTTVAASAPSTTTATGVMPAVTTTKPRSTTTTLGTATSVTTGRVSTTTTPATTTTVTDSSGMPSIPSDNPPPDDADLAPGQTSITRDGAPADADVTEQNGTLVVSVGETTLAYSAKGADGAAKAVSKSGFTVVPGDEVSVSISGAGDGVDATVWLKPGDSIVGNATLASGTGVVAVAIGDDVDSGDKRLVLVTSDPDGRKLIVTQGLRVDSGDSSGPSWSLILLVMIGLGVAAGFLIPAARRRRDEDDAPAQNVR